LRRDSGDTPRTGVDDAEGRRGTDDNEGRQCGKGTEDTEERTGIEDIEEIHWPLRRGTQETH
jgi:hypothetical protein